MHYAAEALSSSKGSSRMIYQALGRSGRSHHSHPTLTGLARTQLFVMDDFISICACIALALDSRNAVQQLIFHLFVHWGYLFIIPQPSYPSRRKLPSAPCGRRITFQLQRGEQRDIGIRLVDLYPGQNAERVEEIGLVDARTEIDFGRRKKILHRLRIHQWGEQGVLKFERAVSSCRSTAEPAPITRFTVGKHVAQTVLQCLQEHNNRWVVLDGTIVRYEDIVLVELVQVSRASWQPVLAYLRPL